MDSELKHDIQHAVTKFTSARFIMAIMFSSTYCVVILACVYLNVKGVMKLETFLGIFTGFTAVAVTIVKSYFERKDRKNGGS